MDARVQPSMLLVPSRWTPFAYGFRPFFFASLLYAPLGVVAWLCIRATGGLPVPAFPPQLWHGHEMIFGFGGAAIAGFLLTAVPSWTGARGFAGKPLVLLTLLWVAGRAAFAGAAWIPLPLVVGVELTFFPVLIAMLAPPLLRARNRNTPLLLVLAALWVADAVYSYAMLRGNVALASTVLRAAIDVVLLLITVIGGRIVPAFTGNALRKRGIEERIRTARWLEITVIAVMAAAVVIDIVAPSHGIAAIVAGIAACAHAVRMAGWQGLRTLREPIVWVLHVAYAWLPIGLALKALSLGAGVPWATQWLHALTMGAIAMMVVAVITRASLGHTGRPLTVSRVVAVAYLLLAAAALLRVSGGGVFDHYEWTVRASGALWLVAFTLVLIVYTPVLLRSRIDGKPG